MGADWVGALTPFLTTFTIGFSLQRARLPSQRRHQPHLPQRPKTAAAAESARWKPPSGPASAAQTPQGSSPGRTPRAGGLPGRGWKMHAGLRGARAAFVHRECFGVWFMHRGLAAGCLRVLRGAGFVGKPQSD